MATIRQQLSNLHNSSNPKEESIKISKSLENLEINLSGYIYRILKISPFKQYLDSEYFILKVNKYRDIDDLLKFYISIVFLQDYNNINNDLENKMLKFLKDKMIEFNLSYIFNDIIVNNKQWRNND